MPHRPVRPTHGPASTSRRIALFFLAIIVLVAAIAGQRPTIGVAGAGASTIYVPLIAKSDGSTAAATATAVATPTATATATLTETPTGTATADATATATATATITATATQEQPQTFNVTGTVYLKPRFAQQVGGQCVSTASPTWVNVIDSTHTITNTSERSAFGLPADLSVYGYTYLSNIYGQTIQVIPVQVDAATGALSYTFTNLAPGVYSQTAYVVYKGDDQPTPVARSYSRMMMNGLPVQNRHFDVVPGSPSGVLQLDPIFLDLRLNDAVCPAL